MSRTQYQIYTSPVLEGGELLTAKIESRWHQPWSEPVRQQIAPRLAIALIVSGLTAPVLTDIQLTDKLEPRWHQPWSKPVRVSINPRLAVALANSGFTGPYVKDEVLTGTIEARWHQPWSEPSVKTPSGLKVHLQQFDMFQDVGKANDVLLNMIATEVNADMASFGIGINTIVPRPYVLFAKCYVSIDEIDAISGAVMSTSIIDP